MQMVLADPDHVRHNRVGHYPAKRVAGGIFATSRLWLAPQPASSFKSESPHVGAQPIRGGLQ